jgi:C2H2-type zinc finger
MGGQSFKCPLCPKWFEYTGSLRDHLKDKHNELPHFKLEGIASHTTIV